MKSAEGSARGSFEFRGDATETEAVKVDEYRLEDDTGRYTVTLYYQESNIVHPGDELPTGTPFRLDELREFRLSVEAVEGDDMADQKGFNAHIRPRWKNMRVENEYGDERTLN
ncbi:hypothetical protein GJ629_15340, partial [Halapricum sp. CBA1109]|nr:hypothetical protein [Halapricum sp. CBA1109]